ncbi:MAG: hypothetical protein IPJ84_14865 [Bdellovibrionales bacterium]|nr:hypothetical protein [Bdellovibrionales bacterium]
METLNGQAILALEKKPFAATLKGHRIRLVRSEPSFADQVWEYIQRDHALGGTLYSWVESLDDVANHVLKKTSLDAREIDFLI